MSDIRKRKGAKGTTYQVRYPSSATKAGFAYKTFSSLKEARQFREDAVLRAQGQPKSRDVQSVKDGIQKWLEVCEHEGRGGRDRVTLATLQNYQHLAGIILNYDWDKPLYELSAPDVVEFRSWLMRTRPRDQARKTLSAFHSMIIEMIGRGQLPHDIAYGINIPAKSRYDRHVAVPSVADVGKILAAADRLANSKNAQIQRAWERYRPMLYLAADSGMRPQEYIALPRSNIDDSGVTVDRALERSGHKISTTKTPAGRRYINLSSHTLEMLARCPKRALGENEHDLVFATSSGRWLSPNNWRNRGFYVACIEAGLVREVEDSGAPPRSKFKPYDLRHFYASMLIEQRTNLKRIQYLMGHRDIQTTLNVYGHLIDKADVSDADHPGLLESIQS